jgi:hypothetical protein
MFSYSKCSIAIMELYRIEESFELKPKAATISLIILMSIALLFVPLSQVNGQSPYGLALLQITEQGGYQGIQSATVGESVNIVATLDTSGGAYKLWWGNTLVDSNKAAGYYVSSNFTIPEGPAGNYTITLMDVTENLNTTETFPVVIKYNAAAVVPSAPAQLQEGDNIVLNVTVTGGEPNTAYVADITVALPSTLPTNLNGNFSRIVSLTTSSLGTAMAQINFPDTSFQPSGSSTIYAGTYTVSFNATQSLGQSTFTVGFTDQSIYHRQDTVKVRAVGYQPSQTGTVAIQLLNSTVVFSQSVTADSQGVITANWAIPMTAEMGTYTATITPQTNAKAISDTQSFSIPGYVNSFRAVNLAGEVVPEIVIEAVDKATNVAYNGTTYFDGIAILNLEKGNSTVSAYWNGVKVGEIQVAVSGNGTYTMPCKLADIKVTVQAALGNQKLAIPFVNLNVTYTYVETKTGATQTRTVSGQTDLNGTYTFNSTLPGINYAINAYKYGVVFNNGNNTVSNLPAQPTVQVTVICPEETLTLNIVDYNTVALPNVRITLIEQASGIFYSANADSTGSATVHVAFGQYRVSVYTADNILLNETVITVVNDAQNKIQCVLYNLPLSVKVVDYFGNPISNMNVQLSTPGTSPQLKTTQGDGTATFNVIGGNLEITAYPSGNENAFVAKNIQVESSTAVQLQMSSYVSVGGMLIGTSLLATIIIILVAVLVVLGVELFRRIRKRGAAKSES